MIVINEKPMSVNDAWMGSKRKTKEYRVYEVNVSSQLPDMVVPEGKLQLKMNVYYSSRASDLDNSVKPFLDILQKRYGFNDSKIYHIEMDKFIVPKGEEKIEFILEAMNEQ